ncbi:MAG: cobalamin biosynthesis protein CbiM [Comamonadaceae bacterium CG_4_10_14_3_um_filter_60_42]|nr:MAG: cobalamin biosynthesis protein CbiM [Comamonadaceae bacterium CG_4_10_14_3_um_filter_60_42]
MHMADALLSPAVGAAFWLVSGTTLAWSAHRLKSSERDDLVPLMGVLGAFVFAAQMINFSIPGTGSSGHMVGGLLLSILLGSPAALIVIASVLTVQSLFFADGGLLALGANLFNMGVMSCLVAYPLIYRTLMPRSSVLPSARRMAWAAVITSVVGLQLGALGVVLQTQLSGISSLPLGAFLWLMQPIHLAIGLGEGLATAALLVFIRQARPDLLMSGAAIGAACASKAVAAGFGAAAVVVAGALSWFASSQPDGLERSIEHVTGQTQVVNNASDLHQRLSNWQTATALFKDYTLNFQEKSAASPGESSITSSKSIAESAWPAVDAGTSLAGVVGGLLTLCLVWAVAYWLRRRVARVK